MKKTTQLALLPFSIASVMALTACGGGSGDSTADVPTAAQVVITEQNSEEVASEAVSAVSGAEDLSEIATDLPIGAQIQTSGIKLPQVSEIISQSLKSIDLQNLSSLNLPVGVSVNETVPCDSGSLTVSGNLSNEYEMSSGDSLNIRANSCNLDGSTINGNISVDVLSYSNSYSKMNVRYSNFSMAYNDYYDGNVSVQIPSLNGTAEIWGDMYYGDIDQINVSSTGRYSAQYGSESISASMNNFVVQMEAFNYSDERIAYDGLIQTTVNGNSIGAMDIETLQPLVFTYYGDYPESGQLKVYGSQGQLRLTANGDDTVTVETDANEDGTYESTKVLNWDDLGSDYL